MAECIHGLDVPLCDICYPKAAPERPKAARPAAAPRPARAASGASSAAGRKAIVAGEQRVYHVTHVRNLEQILADGRLSVDVTPAVDVSSELTRELRLTASAGELLVAEYVPFYFAPDAVLWEDLRAGAVDETRWSDAARTAAPLDFVFLVTTIAQLGAGVVVADGDAAATFTRFSSGDNVQRAVERLHGDEDGRRRAEVLAPGEVPFAAIQLIGVANDRVRDRVRELVGSRPAGTAGSAPKVAVYPPWFQPA